MITIIFSILVSILLITALYVAIIDTTSTPKLNVFFMAIAVILVSIFITPFYMWYRNYEFNKQSVKNVSEHITERL